MRYKMIYNSPLGEIVLTSEDEYLTGLWFKNSEYDKKMSIDDYVEFSEVFGETIKWLDIYFSGIEPDYTPKYKVNGLTPFRKEVINILREIPFGEVVTYGDIAKKIASSRKIKRMSSQAVGNAVGWNPICIIIPCHRVIGSNGNLTGYGGGIENKINLLKLEKVNTLNFYIPKKGNKL